MRGNFEGGRGEFVFVKGEVCIIRTFFYCKCNIKLAFYCKDTVLVVGRQETDTQLNES